MTQTDYGRRCAQPAGGPTDLSPQAVSAKGAHQAQRLKPCPTPWCGHGGTPYVFQGCDEAYTVICEECQVEGPWMPTAGEASEAWNQRSLGSHDGYANAFYEIGAMLGFNASPEGPAHVWEHRMRPRLQAIMEAVEALEEAGWHIKLMAGDIKNPLQKRMADRWVAEARTAAAKARGEA